MYTPEPSPPQGPVPAPQMRAWSGMPLNVWAIGVTSLLTDVSSEMVTSVLPLYVVLHLQWSPLAFGALDGAYQGVASLVRLGGGVVGDRWRSHKAVAVCGYGVSALAKLGYLAAGAAWPALTAALVADRLGKGVRTAPRDALIASSAPPGRMGAAFGLHRMMDAAGAALGPALVFALLAWSPGRFEAVFATSFWLALVGVAAIALLVDGRVGTHAAPLRRVAWSRLGEVLAGGAYRGALVAAVALALVSVSDAFLYLVVQRLGGIDASRLPLLFVGTQIVYFALAGQAGVWADRHGPRRVFLGGHMGLVAAYCLLAVGSGGLSLAIATTACLGIYYAATDGVLSALVSRVVPEDLRGTALGLLTTGTTAGRAVAAVTFGALWTAVDTSVTLSLFAVGAAAALVVAARWLPADVVRPGAPA